MDELVIDEHAYKHGITEEQIIHAWENFVRKQFRQSPREDQVVAVGYDKQGKMIQLVGVTKPFGTLIYHAMEPPTMNVLIELGLARR